MVSTIRAGSHLCLFMLHFNVQPTETKIYSLLWVWQGSGSGQSPAMWPRLPSNCRSSFLCLLGIETTGLGDSNWLILYFLRNDLCCVSFPSLLRGFSIKLSFLDKINQPNKQNNQRWSALLSNRSGSRAPSLLVLDGTQRWPDLYTALSHMCSKYSSK